MEEYNTTETTMQDCSRESFGYNPRDWIISGVSLVIGAVLCFLLVSLIYCFKKDKRHRWKVREKHPVVLTRSVCNETNATYGFISGVSSLEQRDNNQRHINVTPSGQFEREYSGSAITDVVTKALSSCMSTGIDPVYSLAKSVKISETWTSVDGSKDQSSDVQIHSACTSNETNASVFSTNETKLDIPYSGESSSDKIQLSKNEKQDKLTKDETVAENTNNKKSKISNSSDHNPVSYEIKNETGKPANEIDASLKTEPLYQNFSTPVTRTDEPDTIRSEPKTTINPNVARVKPTVHETEPEYNSAEDEYGTTSYDVVQGAERESVKQDKGVQTDLVDEPRDSRTFGYSKPKDTGTTRKVELNSEEDYDYASFINLIKLAVQTSLKEDDMDVDAVKRSNSARHFNRNMFKDPGHATSLRRLQSACPPERAPERPPEQLPMPGKATDTWTDNTEYGNYSAVRTVNLFRDGALEYDGTSEKDVVSGPKSPLSPYIDPSLLHTNKSTKENKTEGSSDSEDDDHMAMDDDFKDYVNTLKKQKPFQKAENIDKSGQTHDRHISSGTIQVDIRKSIGTSEGKNRGSFIHIEINENILSRLKKKTGHAKSNIETCNDKNLPMNEIRSQVGAKVNIDDDVNCSSDDVDGDYMAMNAKEDIYLDMSNPELLCKDDDIDTYSFSDRPDADTTKANTGTGHFYLTVIE